MPQVREGYGMALVDGGNVIMCGGVDDSGLATSTCLLYNATVNEWLTFPSLPHAIYYFPMIILHGELFVCGGFNDIEKKPSNAVYTLNTTSGAWIARALLPVGLWIHNAVVNDTLDTALVCGGVTGNNRSSAQSACYSFASNVWTQLTASLNTARSFHGMTVYKGAKRKCFHLTVRVYRLRVCVWWL